MSEQSLLVFKYGMLVSVLIPAIVVFRTHGSRAILLGALAYWLLSTASYALQSWLDLHRISSRIVWLSFLTSWFTGLQLAILLFIVREGAMYLVRRIRHAKPAEGQAREP
jgi:hypothetical protein